MVWLFSFHYTGGAVYWVGMCALYGERYIFDATHHNYT